MDPEGTKSDDDKAKKLNENFVEFMRKRSDTDAPRYTARLKTYLDFQRKRDRASAARRKYDTGNHEKTAAASKKKAGEESNKGHENIDHPASDNERVSRSSKTSAGGETSEGSYRPLHRGSTSDIEPDPFSNEPFVAAKLHGLPPIRADDKCMPRARSYSRSRSGEPSDKCCPRRKKRRRRSCGRRRRRRRRSCRRKRSRRRRRKRSCRRKRSRRRRRKSCCCKRKKRRRRGRC